MYKRRAEETYKELAAVNERLDEMKNQLAKSAETETCLRKCVDNLTALADAERARQDAETRKIVSALNALMRAAKHDNRTDRLKLSVQHDLNDKLAAENDRLAAVLSQLDEVEVSLNERVVALQHRVSLSNDGHVPRRQHYQTSDATARQGGDEDDDNSSYSPRFGCADGHDSNGRPRPFSRSMNSYDFSHIPTENDELNSTETSLDVQEL